MKRIYEVIETIAKENIKNLFNDESIGNYMVHTKLFDNLHLIYISHENEERCVVYTGCYLRYVPDNSYNGSVFAPGGQNLGDVIYFDEPIVSN